MLISCVKLNHALYSINYGIFHHHCQLSAWPHKAASPTDLPIISCLEASNERYSIRYYAKTLYYSLVSVLISVELYQSITALNLFMCTSTHVFHGL